MLFPKLTTRRRVLNGYVFDYPVFKELLGDGGLHSNHYLNLLTSGIPRSVEDTKVICTYIALLCFFEGRKIPTPIEAGVNVLDHIIWDNVQGFFYRRYPADSLSRFHGFVCMVTKGNSRIAYHPGSLTSFIQLGYREPKDWADYITLRLRSCEGVDDIPSIFVYLYSSNGLHFSRTMAGVTSEDWDRASDSTRAIAFYLMDPEEFPLPIEYRSTLIRFAREAGNTTVPDSYEDDNRSIASAIKVLTLMGEPEVAESVIRMSTVGAALGKDWSLTFNRKTFNQMQDELADELFPDGVTS